LCDTVVATAEATADGVTLFGKNSDREPNEAQQVVRNPRCDYPAGSSVRLTYIEIPQVEHTFATLLSKPFWMWGAEMGVNEHGVAAGNEAVFTKVPYIKEGALTGMDLLRLGLERGSTAYEALMVMTGLLSAYGQGGNGGFQNKFYYHNSYIIADPQSAWVLETAGAEWAARQVKGIYTISNGLTIGGEWDLASPDLVKYAIDRKWCKSRDDFDFAGCYSDWVNTHFSNCRGRCQRTTEILSKEQGKITVRTLMGALRDHGAHDPQHWSPDQGLTGPKVCMHAGFGPVRANQTVGSMVSHLHPKQATHFFTASAAPCTSLIKPAWIDTDLPEEASELAGTYDARHLFWRHERLHRSTLIDYPRLVRLYQDERDEIEARFISQALGLTGGLVTERAAFVEHCYAEAEAAEERWLAQVKAARLTNRNGPLYQAAWRGFNQSMPDLEG
jgi:dipeptidase